MAAQNFQEQDDEPFTEGETGDRGRYRDYRCPDRHGSHRGGVRHQPLTPRRALPRLRRQSFFGFGFGNNSGMVP